MLYWLIDSSLQPQISATICCISVQNRYEEIRKQVQQVLKWWSIPDKQCRMWSIVDKHSVACDQQFYSTVKSVTCSVHPRHICHSASHYWLVSEDEVLVRLDFSDYRNITFREWILLCKHVYLKLLFSVASISLLCQSNVLSTIESLFSHCLVLSFLIIFRSLCYKTNVLNLSLLFMLCILWLISPRFPTFHPQTLVFIIPPFVSVDSTCK